MSRRSVVALARITTAHGTITARKAWAAKQDSFVIVLDGPTLALQAVLPDWRPRSATSTRAQVTPSQPATTVAAIAAAVTALLPTWRAAAAGRPAPPASLVTLADSRTQAEADLSRSVRSSSLAAYQKRWRRLDAVLPASTPLVEIDRTRIQAVVQALAGTLSPAGVRNHLTALHRALAPAICAGVVASTVFAVTLPRIATRPPRHLDRAQRTAVLAAAAARSRDVHLLFALGLYAGLRRAELLALRWADIDLAAGVLVVRSAADGSFTTKSGRSRTVPLCAPLADLLARERPADGAGFVLKPDQPPRRGLRWAFAKSFARVADQAGVPWLAPHDLRRTFATLAVQGGISIWKIRVWLGHTTVSTTERYTGETSAFDSEVQRLG